MPARTLLSAFAALLFCAVLSACQGLNGGVATAPAQRPPLILISIDGFRADYLQRGRTPNLKALADGGARGSMRPSFPSLTFPNHYTLVTGKLPDHHGMVANYMYDPTYPGATAENRLAYFDKKKGTDGFWWKGATPMWVSAERAGLNVVSVYWPGSQAEIGGVRLAHAPEWQQSTSQSRVDMLLSWMDVPAAERPRASLLYFDQVDNDGHHHGPDSPELNASIAEVDAAVGRLLDGLKARGIAANIVIVSDHGMIDVSPQRTYYISQLLGKDGLPADAKTDPRYDIIYWGSVAMLNPLPGHEAEVDQLTRTHYEHMQCWHKGDIPARYRFGRNPRVTEIVCLAEPGWQVAGFADVGTDVGNHGYDPTTPEMAALFIANGPSIEPGVSLPVFDNVDVYSLEMRLLGLRPEPNDGSLKALRPVLK